ncbi:DNA-binding transcriptional MocR family regulator [Constrictibacter sp. MBR-5]|jgi:DNA-binding transcriptional MocR family regulator|uniref:aminotransferase-like domain-containing protein n=1 Tax=Constrictibacter sp. MBR-5 TaxID=3156467 RepID=UPI00339747B5
MQPSTLSGSGLSDLCAQRASRMAASEIRELLKILERPGLISFAGGIPDPALFDVEAFRTAYAGALARPEAAAAALQYSTSEGYLPLRRWIAAHMARSGVDCTPDNILITSGSQQAIELIGKLFIDEGDTLLTAAPTYLGALQAFAPNGPRYDTLGDNVTAAVHRARAEAAGSRVKLIYLVPDFANPSGDTLSLAERARIVDMAAELGCLIVEDGAYTALRYGGEELPPIAALDARRAGSVDAGRTLYCGTFSKTLSPALRVGWICGPRETMQRLTLAKQAADLHSATINQVAMHAVAEACYDDRVAAARHQYRIRRDAMLAALDRHAPPGMDWTRPDGGLFVWVTLPPGVDGRRLLKRAIEEANIAFVPGRAFFAEEPQDNTLRLSFSLADPARIETGMERLCDLIRSEVAALRAVPDAVPA